ncbi:MAG TPA: C-terminal helicase domain-containing protein, partial [Chitinophagaceae bacterium]
WKVWIAENEPEVFEKLQHPIDIIITTDVLSEGQNLQDADMVINYDIHWNPVRVIQRMGRIDRLGSPNETIYGINFWPSNNINSYLNLQGRIEHRMAQMKLAGSEVNLEFSDTFRDMAENESLEQKQKDKMMRQMESTWDEIDGGQNLGFDDFSLENFRQDLLEELKEKESFYKSMPKGVYTGFVKNKTVCTQEGIIALMGYPARPAKSNSFTYKGYELIYINLKGEAVLLNQKEVLDALSKHKNEIRYVPEEVDNGNPAAIQKLSDALLKWLHSKAVSENIQDDGSKKQTVGTGTLDLINKIKSGSKEAINQLKTEGKPSDKFSKDNFDLIVWFVVS